MLKSAIAVALSTISAALGALAALPVALLGMAVVEGNGAVVVVTAILIAGAGAGIAAGEAILRRAEPSDAPWTGRCWECGYDLRGLRSERCPECGHPLSRHQRRYLAARSNEPPPA